MGIHHLMVGTWTPPGAIFTFEFDDEARTLKLIKRTAIPEDEPISWMTFDVSRNNPAAFQRLTLDEVAQTQNHLWRRNEEMELLPRQEPNRD